jgi:hypothetical protein
MPYTSGQVASLNTYSTVSVTTVSLWLYFAQKRNINDIKYFHQSSLPTEIILLLRKFKAVRNVSEFLWEILWIFTLTLRLCKLRRKSPVSSQQCVFGHSLLILLLWMWRCAEMKWVDWNLTNLDGVILYTLQKRLCRNRKQLHNFDEAETMTCKAPPDPAPALNLINVQLT